MTTKLVEDTEKRMFRVIDKPWVHWGEGGGERKRRTEWTPVKRRAKVRDETPTDSSNWKEVKL